MTSSRLRRSIARELFGAVGLGLVAASLAPAQSAARSRPAVGRLAITHPPNALRRRLANGIDVIELPFGSTPKTEIRVVVTLPDDALRSERQSMLSTIWQRGTLRVIGDALRDSIEHMGGSLAVTSSTAGTSLSLDLLSSDIDAGIALVAAIIRKPAIDSSLVATLDRNRARRESRGGDEGDVGSAAVALFERDVLGIAGGRSLDADMRPRTPADIASSYADLVTPDRVRIYLTGRFDQARARRALTNAFGDWTVNMRVTPTSTNARVRVEPVDSARLVLVHRQGARQSGIVVGAFVHLRSDTLFPQLRVLDALLGGSLNSRITTNIREEKGYAYSPASRLVHSAKDRAYWAEVTDVAADVTWATLREILHEIEAVSSSNPPTAAEVNGTARFVVGSALMQRASRGGWADEVEESEARGEAWANWDKNLSRVLEVSPSQLRSLAQRVLSPNRLTIVVVGDTTLMAAQADSIRTAFKRLRSR